MEKDMSQQSYLYLFRTKGNLRRMRVIIALGVVRRDFVFLSDFSPTEADLDPHSFAYSGTYF